MTVIAPSLWIPVSIQAQAGSILSPGAQFQTILGDTYVSYAQPAGGAVENAFAGVAKFAEITAVTQQLRWHDMAGRGSFVRALPTDEETSLLNFAMEGRYNPDIASPHVSKLIEAMSKSGWTYEEQRRFMVVVHEKVGYSDLAYFDYKNAAEAVLEMTSKGWSYVLQFKMFSAASSGSDFKHIKPAVIAMEGANWRPERQIEAFAEMQKCANGELKTAVNLLSFLIKNHPEDACARLADLFGRMSQEGIKPTKEIVRDAETTSSYTMGAIGKDTALEAALHRARFLKQWFNIDNQDNLPSWWYSRHIKPLAAVKLSDDLYIQFEIGAAEASSGLQFSLYRVEKSEDGQLPEYMHLGSVGFVELDDRIVVVHYQGGGIGEEKVKVVRDEFRKFSGGVDQMPWLAYFAGRFLLGRAINGGKKLEWLAGDYLLHGYPHLSGSKPPVRTVESARQVMEDGSPELEEYKEICARLKAEKAELEQRIAELWSVGELKGEEIKRLREMAAELEGRIEWFSQPVDMLERAPGRQYDIIAKKLGLKKRPGEPFYSFSGETDGFGRKVKAGAADPSQFDRSIETADGAISNCFTVWPKDCNTAIVDILKYGERTWPLGKNPFLTDYRPPAELATGALLRDAATAGSGKPPVPRKVAETIGTNNATILEDAGEIYLVRNDKTGELIVDALHNGETPRLLYFYFPKTGKMFKNGRLVDVEMVASNASVRVVKDESGNLTAWYVDIKTGKTREEERAYFPDAQKAFKDGRLLDVEVLEVVGYNHLVREAESGQLQVWAVYQGGEVYPPHGIVYFPKNRKSSTFKRSEILEQDGNFYLIKYMDRGEEFMVAITIDPVTGSVNRTQGHYFPKKKLYYLAVGGHGGHQFLPAIILDEGKVTAGQALLITAFASASLVVLARGSDGTLNPLRRVAYIDDQFSFATDDAGRAYWIKPIRIGSSEFYMATIPEPVMQLGRKRDGSGYHENVEIFTRNGDGAQRSATRDEMIGLAEKYLGEKRPELTLVGEGVSPVGEPGQLFFDTPKLKHLPAYTQKIFIQQSGRSFDIVIEAASPEEYAEERKRLVAVIKETPVELLARVKWIVAYKGDAESYGLGDKEKGGNANYEKGMIWLYDFSNLLLRSSHRRILYHELIHLLVNSADKNNMVRAGIALKAGGADAYRLLESYYRTSDGKKGYFASEVSEYVADAGALLLLSILFPAEFDEQLLKDMGCLKFTSSLIAQVLNPGTHT